MLDGLLPVGVPSFADWFATRAAVAATLAGLALVLLSQVFSVLLFAPTRLGREVGDELAGFRLYLSVAEAERMNLRGRPDFSTELFERYLPYAIALGVEKPWAVALDAHFVRSVPGDDRDLDYSPAFYLSSRCDSRAIGASTAAIASTLGTSFASAMPTHRSGDSAGGGGGGGGW